MKDEYLKTYKWMNSLRGGVLRDVYALIYQLGKKDEVNISVPYICERLGYSNERNVRRAIAELKEMGLLRVEYTDGKKCVFKAEDPCHNSKGNPCYNSSTAKLAPLLNWQDPPAKLARVTPYNILDKTIDNNIVVEEDGARAENLAKNSDKKLLTKWVLDNEEGLTQVLLRAGLITEPKTTAELQAIIEPYINEYYLQMQMNGEEDIERRGRSDVKTHFARWIKKRVQAEKQELNKQNNGNNNHQTSDQRVTNLEDIARSIMAGCQAGRAGRK